MRYLTTFLLAASATLIVAQDAPATTSTSSNPNCKSQKLVDSCVSVMKHGLTKCSKDDWDCKCSGAANIANCYVECTEEDEAGASARSLSVGNCATANAYDQGETTVAPSWTLPGSNAAQPTEIEATFTSEASHTAGPTKVEKSEKSAKPASTSEGAASANVANSWLALVGLGLGIAF